MNGVYAQVSDGLLRLTSKSNDRVLETLSIIPAEDQHRSFILSTWIRSYESTARKLRWNGPNGRQAMSIRSESYRKGEATVAEEFWKLSSVVVSEGDSYTAHAWICGVRGRLYHIYVPPILRCAGIGTGLIETYVGKEYEVHKPFPNGEPHGHKVYFNPWLIKQ